MVDEQGAARREPDLDYFQRRAEQEVRSAQYATDPAAVAAHYAIAETYLDRVARIQDAPTETGGEAD